MAHDLRNQLTVIKCWIDVMEHLALIKEDGIEYLRSIRDAANFTSTLAEELLAFSHHQQVNRSLVNLNEVISDGVKLLNRVLDGDIILEVIPCSDLGNVQLDAGQFQQALLNLVLNARATMPQGGRITIQCANTTFDEAAAKGPAERHWERAS